MVNHFYIHHCEPQTKQLRLDSKAAANISLNEIFKKGALVVKRTVVHLMKFVQVQKNATDVSRNNLSIWLHFFAATVVLRIPLFKNFVNPFFVSGYNLTTVLNSN